MASFKLASLLTATLPLLASFVGAASISAQSLETHVNSLALSASFNAIKDSYWTGYPHHRRTPFALSPDGKVAYLAYLDQSETGVHVQQVDPTTFAAVGTAVTVAGAKEAGGLVAHNDGFALLTNEALPSGTSNAPAGSTPVPVLYRYTGGQQTFKTFLGGPSVQAESGLNASPDLNGDLVYSDSAKLYGAYFVVTAYTGRAKGHFGDSIQYVNDAGERQQIPGASSTFGCSHNTGIAFEDADAAPFASICAEDHGAIWLNSKTQYMNGVKISNENVTNGGSNEPMGGMSGSYSSLARFPGASNYIFTWVSRGAVDLKPDTWMGGSNTQANARTTNRNVAIAYMSDKFTLVGPQAISQAGAADGDSQVNWVTQGSADMSNAHVAALDATNALVTWEEIAQPECPFVAMGCKGAYTGSYFQLVENGQKVGEPVKSDNVYVAGDMVRFADGRVCWPYVDMAWKLDGPIRGGATTQQMSFACMNLDGAAPAPAPPASSPAAPAPVSSTPPVVEVPASPSPVAPSSVAAPGVSSPAVEVPAPSSAAIEEVVSTPAAPAPAPEQPSSKPAAGPTLPPGAVPDLPASASPVLLPASSPAGVANPVVPPVSSAPANACPISSATVPAMVTVTASFETTTFLTVVKPDQASAVNASSSSAAPAPIAPIPSEGAQVPPPPPQAPTPPQAEAPAAPSTVPAAPNAPPAPSTPANGAWAEILKLLNMIQELLKGLQAPPAQQ